MKYPNKDYIEHLRRKYPPGTRLQLSCMEDEMAVPPGSMGTVDFIDDAGHNVKLFVMESFRSLPPSEYTFVFNSFHNISLCLTKFFEPGY